MIDVRIEAMAALSEAQAERCAVILVAALRHMPSAWPDLPSARAEVARFRSGKDGFARAALDAGGEVLGWIGCLVDQPPSAELHPLVVDPRWQRQGIGTCLVQSLETELRQLGFVSLWLGTDDDFGGTNLFGRNLYPDPLHHLQRLAATAKGHPFTFYQGLGYAVTGVLPDANGPGRHDILMAKRLT